VITGKVQFTYADGHSETYEAGDAYYAPPGHLPTLFAGSEIVEFHPTAELEKTMAVVTKNMEAAAAG
jgi:prepilin-type processing-associated H-X9-DG protein